MKKLIPAKVILFFGLLFVSSFVRAQLTVTANPTITQIVNNLAGAGATITNATLVCPNGASAIFSNGGSTNLGIGSGVILTTGSSTATAGSATSFASVDNLGTGNTLLTGMAGATTYEECRLEFDIMPSCGQLQMSYVFGSEEYPEFVNSGYNDAFGFFVSGPNPGGGNYTNQNIAVVPGTSTFVGIDNVNSSTNAGYYVDNSASTTIAYDGLTSVLTASINVTPCASYHMILVIADGGDGVYDSGVFLTYQGLTCPSPTVTVGPPSTICPGQSATLTASGMTTYTWTPGGMTGASVTVTPTVSTVYTVTASQGACNTSTGTVSVTVTSGPTVTVNSATVCPGATATLTATGATTYTWAGGTTPTTGATVNASPGTTTIYTVTGTTSGCTGTATSTVTVAGALNITVNSPTICPGGTATLTATGGTTYSWAGGTTPTTGATVNATPAGTTTYTVTGTTGGCSGTATATVTVSPAIVPTATNTGPYCAGATIQLNGGGGGTYSWTGPNSFSSTAQNPTIAGSTTAMSGTYSVVVTVGTCTASATTSVTVNPLPVPTATNTGPYCAGATIQLNGGGGGTYSWSGPNSFSSTAQNPTIAGSTTAMSGTYTVLVTLGTCTATATTSVTVNPLPVPTATNTGPYCEGVAIQLNGGGGGTYNWTGPNSFSSTAQNPSIAGSTTAMSGTYTVLVTLGTCTATATTSVTVNPLPVPTASNTGPYCPTSTIQLNATGGGTYSWSGPNAFSSTNQNPTIAGATLGMSGTYTVTVTLNSCTATATTSVTVGGSLIPALSSNSPVCEGGALNLSCTNGTIWSWTGPNAFTSTASSPTINPATPLESGTYSVTVTDATGCSGSGTIVVVVNPLPVVTVNSPSVCAGATANLTAAGASTYSWSAGTSAASGANVTASPAATTQYTVTGTDANGCISTAVSTVTINSLPVIVVNSPQICATGTATITASGASTYVWSAGTTPNNAATVTTAPAATTSYTVTGTDANGCVSTAVSTVTVASSLIVDAGQNDTICEGAAFNLTGSGATTYVWSPGAMPGSTVSVSPTVTTTYTVVGTDPTGCIGTDSITISVAPTMTLSTGGFPESCNGSCDGQVVVLVNPTTGPFAVYQYVWSGGAGTNPSANGLCANTYSITVTDLAGCTATSSAQVTQPVAVSAVLTSSTNATCNAQCDGTALITPAGGTGVYTYTWSSVGAGNNPLNLCAGSYTCTVADANNCSTTVPVTITEPAPLTASVAPVNPLCIGQSANLNASASGGTAGYTFTWSAGTTPATGASVSASPVVQTVYTVTVTDANSCPSVQATVTVAVAGPLSVVASPAVTICEGQTANLSAVGSGGNAVYTYAWATGTTPGTGASVTAAPLATTTYTVTVNDGCGTPPATASVTVTVNPLPVLSIVPSVTSGCAPVCVDFAGSSTPASVSCNWTFTDGQNANGNCNPTICFTNAGVYGATLNVTDINGCSNSFTNNSLVTVFPVPTAEFSFSPEEITELAPVVSFTDQSSGAVISTWDWSFGDTANGTSSVQNPVYNYSGAGNYNVTLIVTTADGCTGSVTHPVTINPEFAIYVPNAFSPNADGTNDVFFPKAIGVDTDNYEMWIYDRWGNLIWANTDFLKTWDGKVQGHDEIVQQDVYVWKIKLKTYNGEKKSYVGHVTVVK